MLHAGLRLDQAPPISVPFRFFISAPVFLFLVAVVLLWRGPEVMQSRLSPAAYAVTHLFTLGFMSMVMIGALMQMLPVLAGAPIPRPRAIAGITHAGLGLGALSLASGFLFQAPWLLATGAIALVLGLSTFGAAVMSALWRAKAKGNTVGAIRFATLSLFATVVLGLVLAANRGWGVALPNLAIRDLHPAWGLFGWLGLLAIGIAYQVVPMFQMTPGYPAPMQKYLAGSAFALLVLWSAVSWWDYGTRGPLEVVCALAFAGACVLFAGVTLGLQRRRRRRQPDVILEFWRAGLACLVAANLLWAARTAAPLAVPGAIDVLIGMLALAGFAGSIINGMLYKIAPFLAWFHMQAQAGAGQPVPTMRKILGEAKQRRQFGVHVAALALLGAAVAWPTVLVYPAALALGASAILLATNLLEVLRVFEANAGSRVARSSGSATST